MGRSEQVQTWQRLTAGGCAGVVAATVTYPLDLARTRLSLATDLRGGIFACIRQVYTTEGGFGALYRGLFPTLMVRLGLLFTRPHLLASLLGRALRRWWPSTLPSTSVSSKRREI